MAKARNKELILATLQEYEKIKKREKKSKVFRNTRVLMKNYSILKEHSEKAIYEISEDYKNLYFNDDAEKTYIESILHSKLRTSIMIQHIDMALGLVESECIKKDVETQFYLFQDHFILDETIENLAEKYSISVPTVHRWKNDCLDRLSVALFGIDGLL